LLVAALVTDAAAEPEIVALERQLPARLADRVAE